MRPLSRVSPPKAPQPQLPVATAERCLLLQLFLKNPQYAWKRQEDKVKNRKCFIIWKLKNMLHLLRIFFRWIGCYCYEKPDCLTLLSSRTIFSGINCSRKCLNLRASMATISVHLLCHSSLERKEKLHKRWGSCYFPFTGIMSKRYLGVSSLWPSSHL